MATRSEKNAHIDDLKRMLDGTNSFFVVSLQGLKSNEVNELRSNLRKKGGHVRVVKNRLARRAAAGSVAEKVSDAFVGPTALIHHPTEPVAIAKALFDFAKDRPVIKIRAALVDRSDAVFGAGVKAISDLPTLDQARSMMLAMLLAPGTQLVRLLNTPATQLAYVVSQRGAGAEEQVSEAAGAGGEGESATVQEAAAAGDAPTNEGPAGEPPAES